MAYASVKISASTSDYQSQMKSATAQMKTLSSEYSVAATKAKLFGTETDSLKAKAESLTQKITVQKNIVQLNTEQQKKLTTKLSDQKTKQEELKSKIEAAKKAHEDSAKATGEESEQSKTLKEELDKLEQEYKQNETAIGKTETALANQTTKTNKSRTALMEMEAELENVNNQLKDNKLEDFADNCQSAGEKAEGFGKKMSVISAGIAGVAAASAKSFTELKEGYDTIVKKTGATGDALEDLKGSANNVFGNMPEDMSTVGEAIGEVNTRFHSTGAELEDLSEQFIQFASINDTQITSSVDQVDKIMQAWNIDTSQTGDLLGLLTAKAQETGISVDSLESYVLDNNSAFKEMGLSLPQAVNLMAQFDANGVDTTQALAGLKKALQNATSEGKSMDVALEETIGSIKNATNDTDALQIATELFGKKGAAEMATAIRENRIDLESLSSSMEGYGSIVEETYNGTKSPLDDAKTAMNNAKVAMSELADTAITGAAPVIKDITERIKELTSWFTNLDDGQKQTIVKVGLVIAAVGPLAIGFGKVAQGISATIKTGQQFVSGIAGIIAKITAKTAATAAGTAVDAAGTAAEVAHTAATATATTVTGGMTAAQSALNVAMSLCPIVVVVALIAGLIAAGVALYKNWDTVKEKLTGLWEGVKEKFTAIKDAATEKMEECKANVSKKVEEMKKGFSEKVSNIKSGWSSKFTEMKNKATNLMQEAKQNVSTKLDNMKADYNEKGGGMAGIVSACFTGMRDTMGERMDAANKLTGGKLDVIKDGFASKLKEAHTTVSSVMENIKSAFSSKMDKAKSVVSGAIDKIRNFFNFSWSLPSIKLPHFSITGKFSLNPPSIPHFSVSWYKSGAIMGSEMIFGMNGNTLLAGGEPGTGGEAILPLAPFYTKLNEILDKKLEAVQRTQNVYIESHTYIDGEEVISRTVTKVDAKMVRDKRKGR